jgi:hypothetical protein
MRRSQRFGIAKKRITELLDILAEHILTMSPVTKGVADAASAIEALAARRAEEPEHGDAGHD